MAHARVRVMLIAVAFSPENSPARVAELVDAQR